MEPKSLEIAEIPNVFSLLYQTFQNTAWAAFLHSWENILFSICVASTIALIFYLGSRKREWIPEKFQNTLEWIVETIHKLVTEVLGSEGAKFVPFIGTLFIYILSMNLMGLVPLMKSPSSNLNITAALAICVFCLVQFLNIKHRGVKGFIYHMAGSPKGVIGWSLAPLMFLLEMITQLARPVTLSLRLFGNVFGEHILVTQFVIMGVTLFAPLILPLQLPFMFLGILTSLMQALVFSLLSTIYILLSLPDNKH
ncbi:F0F1 ATP synthase subunit A [Parachlamydia sp. AcF125]|uniref:F0F1 ATP synthase subunit A n=1 Tax=Parachlamydia sp. AcF125 TaxID=2795736 RepID=UPI001BC8FB4E|nr:F0F1 ATP synthase subunit A [Parachlamydia sp. AcF125]MBS4167491.1 ATP synthase subunit a [Parachlamydia sp. AcF125]